MDVVRSHLHTDPGLRPHRSWPGSNYLVRLEMFSSERQALRALVEAVADYGRTEEYGEDQRERDAMFDVQHEAQEYLTRTEPEGDEAE